MADDLLERAARRPAATAAAHQPQQRPAHRTSNKRAEARSRGGRIASTSGVSVSMPTLSTTHEKTSTASDVVEDSAT